MPPEIDPFDVPSTDVDTSFPRLPAATYEMDIAKAETFHNEDKNIDMIKLELKTVQAHRSTAGDELQPGFSLRTQIVTTPTGKLTVDMIKKSVATLAQSARVVGTLRDIMNNPTMLEGKRVRVKVGISKETSEYPERNEVKYFVVE